MPPTTHVTAPKPKSSSSSSSPSSSKLKPKKKKDELKGSVALTTLASQPRAIGDVMTPQPYTIGRDQTLATAHAMMHRHNLRHLPVLEHGQLVGVVTQRDLYFLETIAGVSLERDRIDDAMSLDAYCVPPETPLTEVARTMAERKLGCAVIVERDRVAGIFTATDALRLLAGEGDGEDV